MSLSDTPSTTHTLKPSMPQEYKQQLNMYMKEYRKQHKDAIIDAQKRYREAHKNESTSTYEKRDANIQKKITAK